MKINLTKLLDICFFINHRVKKLNNAIGTTGDAGNISKFQSTGGDEPYSFELEIEEETAQAI